MGPASAYSNVSTPEAGSDGGGKEAVGPYLRAVRRHWVVVLAVTLLTAAVATATVVHSGHTYSASASVLISPLPDTDPAWIGIGTVVDTGDPARTLQTAVALIDSEQAASAAARAMGSDWSADRVNSAVSVTPLGQSDVVSITANGASPGEAARLANRYAGAAVARRGAVVQANIARELTVLKARIAGLRGPAATNGTELSTLSGEVDELTAAQARGGDPTMAVSQSAVPPTSPNGASRPLIVLLSLLGGFALGSIAALALEFFSRPVRDEEELATIFPVPVLASIPRVRRRKGGPVPPTALSATAFEQVRMLRVQLELASETPVIMVTSAGVDDGKTTLAAALAAAFSESGKKVIVMDLDLRRPSLARVLDVDLSTNRRRRGQSRNDPLRRLMRVPGLNNVSLLPMPPGNSDQIISDLPGIIEHAREAADCIILDTAPVGKVSESLRIAPVCETVLFVARLRHTDRRRLILARDLLARVGATPQGVVLMGQSFTSRDDPYYEYKHPAPTAQVSVFQSGSNTATRMRRLNRNRKS